MARIPETKLKSERQMERERPKVIAMAAGIQIILWTMFFNLSRKAGFPFDPLGGLTVISVLAWTIGCLIVTARRIKGHAWILGLALANSFLETIVIFAGFYWHFGTNGNFTASLSRVDALYFTLGTLTTAGTGTIAPESQMIRSLVGSQMILDLILVAGAAAIAVTRLAERD